MERGHRIRAAVTTDLQLAGPQATPGTGSVSRSSPLLASVTSATGSEEHIADR